MKKLINFKSPYIWAFTTYFTEGFPYTIIRQISTLFFRDMGVRLESIGLTSLFGLPWILKFLWGPQVDRFGTRRKWLLVTQAALVVMMFLTAFLAPTSIGMATIPIILFIGSFFAATHDIAIDGYYMEALDSAGQSKFVGYRVMAYRIAMITGTGIVATIGTRVSWFAGFFSAATLFLAMFLYHLFFLPKIETNTHPIKELFLSFKKLKMLFGFSAISISIITFRLFYVSDFFSTIKNSHPFLKKIWFSHYIAMALFLSLLAVILFRGKIKNLITRDPDSYYSKAFLTFIDRKNIGVIFLAIIFLRTGEMMLSSMLSPFIVDLGIKTHYGWLASVVGIPFSIFGALVGGAMISKYSLKKVMWPFLLLQNFTNIIYMLLAFYFASFLHTNTQNSTPVFIGNFNIFLVALTQAFDQFAGGLGTSVLMTFLMRICLKEYKAAHYAIGTGVMNLSGVFVGVAGGFLCSWFGYGWFFGISFAVSIPGMIFAGMLPRDVLNK